jgi:GNAT superfamily N-acetyltransferase
VTPGNLELVQVVVFWAATLPSVTAIIVHDERRLRGVALARAWPTLSRDAAIFGLWNFGLHPWCVLVHFIRTRRDLRGAGIGGAWVLAVYAAGLGAEMGAAALVDWLGI